MNCKNCGHNVEEEFCGFCGQNSNVGRIDYSNFIREITESVFQVNKGFFYTIRELFIRPGKSIRDFLSGKRRNHFKPIAFVLLLSTLYYLISQLTNQNTWMDDLVSGMLLAGAEQGNALKVSKTIIWFSKNYAYSSLLLLPFFSLASYISFSEFDTNYLEHIVLNSFIAGQQAILYSLLAIVGTLIENSDLVATFSLLISFLYLYWVFQQFFSIGSRMGNLLRTLMTYMLYLILNFFLLILNMVVSGLIS